MRGDRKVDGETLYCIERRYRVYMENGDYTIIESEQGIDLFGPQGRPIGAWHTMQAVVNAIRDDGQKKEQA